MRVINFKNKLAIMALNRSPEATKQQETVVDSTARLLRHKCEG